MDAAFIHASTQPLTQTAPPPGLSVPKAEGSTRHTFWEVDHVELLALDEEAWGEHPEQAEKQDKPRQPGGSGAGGRAGASCLPPFEVGCWHLQLQLFVGPPEGPWRMVAGILLRHKCT